MAEKQAAPDAVIKIRVSQVMCEQQSGPLRSVAQLPSRNALSCVKAIWRNEVGKAACTLPQVSA